jgi:maleylpyruvate isomerase
LDLYSYFRSSAAYRVRIALNLKGLSANIIPVHLLREGGQHLLPAYRSVNPDALVPTLVDAGQSLYQSLAIIEYLEETHPEPPLLPAAPLDRAHVRALALSIACDIHPLNNMRVLKYLKRLNVDDAARDEWYRHWIEIGFEALEIRLANDPRTGEFAFGDTPTLADALIVPQVFNARRFSVDLAPFPTIERVADNAGRLPAFMAAAPAAQPDSE